MLNNIIKLSPEHFPISTIFQTDGATWSVLYTVRNPGSSKESDFSIGAYLVNGCPDSGTILPFEIFHSSQVERIISCPTKRISSLNVENYDTQENGPDSVSWYYIKLCELFGVSIKRDKAYKHFFFSDIVVAAINQMGYGAIENFNTMKMISLVEKQKFVKRHSTKDSNGEYHDLFVINKKRLKRFIKQNANRCLNSGIINVYVD